MKLKLLFPMLFACSVMAAERPPKSDPLDENLFPPELIMQNADEINLTEGQKENLESDMHNAQERFVALHADRERQLEALSALLKKERVDEPTVLAQFDKLMDKEREIRRAHLSLVVGLKNKLTAEQQSKLQAIKQKSAKPEKVEQRPGKPPPASLQEKMKKVKAGVKKLEDEGGDATSIGEVMQDFKPLMDEQKFKQAEEVLDHALKLLQDYKR